MRKRPLVNASFPDRGGEQRSEPVPLVSNRFMADIDAVGRKNCILGTFRQRLSVKTFRRVNGGGQFRAVGGLGNCRLLQVEDVARR
jgi:hypothetical protein